MTSTLNARKVGLYGKANPQFPVGLKDLATYTTAALPTPPASVMDGTTLTFPMDGNDQYGDCTMAAAAHSIQVWNAVAKEKDKVPALQAIVNEYFKLTGGPDSGLVEANVLKAWNTTGLWGNKIIGYAPVNVHNQTLLQQAIYLFGLVYVGIQVPANAEQQFSAGQPWTLVQDWQSQQIVGGHAIPIIGYDANYLYVVTWGEVQKMAYDWWQTYGDEAWAILPEEFKQAGKYDSLNLQQLQADLQSV